MQSEDLIVYKGSPYSDVKKEVKDEVGNALTNAGSGLCNVVADGVQEMSDIFIKCMDNVDKTLEFGNIFEKTLGIGTRADVLYRCIERQSLMLQNIVKKCLLKVSSSGIVDIGNLSPAQKQLVTLELSRYLGKGIQILKKFALAFKVTFACFAVIYAFYFIYKIYKADNRLKELLGVVIKNGVQFAFSSLGLFIGGVIGAFVGPVGSVVGSIIGGIVVGLIGSFCRKIISSLVETIFFPKYTGGPGQPPIEGVNHVYSQPQLPCVDAVKVQTQVRGLIPKGQPKIPGAEAAFGLPKLW